MKYIVEKGSDVMIYVPRFLKVGTCIHVIQGTVEEPDDFYNALCWQPLKMRWQEPHNLLA
jgi:hypothetical protein